ncbi:MAG: hypothetical protein A2340_05350 [Lentisphaerae bacterium RIFOXYB12_FULL_60_10]|nr:MAG: hypothetical protein A2340_05350 [Lentisphaerae bacterium RIFOXYB12_FULL_60_10]
MKKWILAAVLIAALGGGLWYALYYPWIKMGEISTSTCSRCGSNKDTTVLFGRLGREETNRFDTVTFRGTGFDSCQHVWVPGQSPTNKNAEANQASQAIGAAAPQPER